MPPVKNSLPEGIKILTEAEIQQRLYGRYLSGQRTSNPSPEASQLRQVLPSPDPQWNGTEILAGELHRLRKDLIALRQEREHLELELKRQAQSLQSTPTSLEADVHEGAWSFFRKLVGGVVLLVCLGTPIGFRLLQASPAGHEPTPYTVQVAVYDVKGMAEDALGRLQRLGYPAFLIEMPTLKGKPRYRIYIGRFVTKTEAKIQRERIAADLRFSDAFVRLQ